MNKSFADTNPFIRYLTNDNLRRRTGLKNFSNKQHPAFLPWLLPRW